MKILIAGMYRSASTKLYNIVRLACEQDGKTYACFSDAYNLKVRNHNVKHEVVKIHKWDREWADWADIVLTSYRPYAEALESARRFGIDDHDLFRSMEWLIYWNRLTKNMFSFNQLVNKEISTVYFLIYKVIDLPHVNVERLLHDLDTLQLPESGHDPLTLLHSNHMTNVKT